MVLPTCVKSVGSKFGSLKISYFAWKNMFENHSKTSLLRALLKPILKSIKKNTTTCKCQAKYPLIYSNIYYWIRVNVTVEVACSYIVYVSSYIENTREINRNGLKFNSQSLWKKIVKVTKVYNVFM